jgi:thioesterase domain-containing protein/aryl carrier-like protein
MTGLGQDSTGAVIERRAGRPDIHGDLIADLTAAAEQVLNIAPIKPDDDLFDMGCDSIQALTLLMEIEARTGRSLTPSDLYEAPTIAELAALLAAPQMANSSRLFVLRPGDPAVPPVFMAPGLGSTAAQLLPIARALDTSAVVYGLEPAGLDMGTLPHRRIEDMAAEFAAVMGPLGVNGTYHLVGFCFGGLIAAEIAQQLAQARRTPDGVSLTMIATFPHTSFWPVTSRVRAWARLIGQLSWGALAKRVLHHHLPALRAMPRRQAVRHAAGLAWRGAKLPLRIFGLSAYARADRPDSVNGTDMPSVLQRLRQASLEAFGQYAPRRYDGETLLVTAQVPKRLPFDSSRFWSRRIARLRIEHVASEPVDMLSDHVQAVAAVVSRFIAPPVADSRR